ncbi:hypothetical protein GQ44DRAFT_780304 [Phaeosphaeriaceae sp. PMI808]|nr:hypothetical protein GQ44DRAFT_780304 [Phaeosphaeriaceae sp. PMI808]
MPDNELSPPQPGTPPNPLLLIPFTRDLLRPTKAFPHWAMHVSRSIGSWRPSHVHAHSWLSEPRNNIRLLQLLPRKDDEQNLCCEIFEVPLRTSNELPRPYEALSYVWGDPTKTQSIIVVGDKEDKQSGNRVLGVTKSLYEALSCLRDDYISRFIWADGICIDQSETEAGRKDKEDQTPLMTEIYAKASRVTVWLGLANNGGNEALKELNSAAQTSTSYLNTQASEKIVSDLLARHWFSRIWVLQEVGAARHIVIRCGSTEIDGYAFCLGLDHFRSLFTQSLLTMSFLIRGVALRPRNLQAQNRISLETASLGELIDMYHARRATKLHDKVYALLGMCLEDYNSLGTAGLKPNYSLDWSILMQNLVKFLLGDQISVETWKEKEKAVFKSQVHVLGRISKAAEDPQGDVQNVEAIFWDPSEKSWKEPTRWTLRNSAKLILVGDAVCMVPGGSNCFIARPLMDHLAIIVIKASLPEHIALPEPSKPTRAPRELLFVWDWEISSENFQHSYDAWTLTFDLQSEHTRAGPEGQIARGWNIGLMLGELGKLEEAAEKLEAAISLAKEGMLLQSEVVEKLVSETAKMSGLRDMNSRGLLSHAAETGYVNLVELLLGIVKINLKAPDRRGLTPYSWAARNGQVAVMKQLIQASADFEGGFLWRALSWAARSGHDAVVKQLVEVGAETEYTDDEFHHTPLSFGAHNGHAAVVEVLAKAGANINITHRDSGHKPLQFAAQNGHEAVVKVLVEAGADIESKSIGKPQVDPPLALAAQNGHEAVVKEQTGQQANNLQIRA